MGCSTTAPRRPITLGSPACRISFSSVFFFAIGTVSFHCLKPAAAGLFFIALHGADVRSTGKGVRSSAKTRRRGAAILCVWQAAATKYWRKRYAFVSLHRSYQGTYNHFQRYSPFCRTGYRPAAGQIPGPSPRRPPAAPGRVSGDMVVIHIISGSFSPSPLERWTLTFLPSSFFRISAFSFSE